MSVCDGVFGPLSLSEDWHVHSTFSDGRGTLAELRDRALERGLDRLCFADHVRRDTDWVLDYVRAVRQMRQTSHLELLCGVEAKLLDEDGTLDLPESATACDVVLVADHRLPFERRCLDPREARRLLRDGRVTPHRLVEGLVRALCGSLRHDKPMIVAHLFSILPKVGLAEEAVDRRLLVELAGHLRSTGAVVEISERWRCPSTRTLGILAEQGVSLVASTDSHDLVSVGRYEYVALQAQRLSQRCASDPVAMTPELSEGLDRRAAGPPGRLRPRQRPW